MFRKIFCIAAFVLVFSAVSIGGEKTAVRVVSLGPSITEMIFQLGQESCLVGRSSACDYPEKVKDLPAAGNMGIPFMEKLASLKPDYVFVSGFRDKRVKKAIEELGIKVIVVPGETLSDYTAGVKMLGDALGCPDAAEAEIKRFNGELEAFKAENDKTTSNLRPKVYLEIWHRPLQTCGKKSFLNEMIDYAGGVNIAASEDKEYFRCSEEWIIKQNPDVIICPGMGSGKSGEVNVRQGWGAINAVKNNRIYTGLDQNLIFRLGPRTTEGIKILRGCVTGNVAGQGK